MRFWIVDFGFRIGFRTAACAAALSVAAPALAQRANGPYAGAFGPQPDANRTQGLDLSMAFFGAADQNTFPKSEASDLLDPRLKETGASGGMTGSLVYSRLGDAAHFTLSGGGAARQYASAPDQVVAAYQARTSLTAKISPKLSFEGSGSAAYSPFFEFAPFLDTNTGSAGTTSPGFGYAAAAQRNIALDASLGLTSTLTKRTSLFATAAGRDWRTPDDPQFGLRTWGGRAGIKHNLTRGLGLHFVYGRDENEYALEGATTYINETIDAGVDYGDTLSFDRRTALSFSTTTTATRYLGETHYRLNGAARLTRGFGRTWSAWLGYHRDTEYRTGFRAPLLTDSIMTGAGGQLAWRMRWMAQGGYTRGTVGFGSDDFSSYSGSSRVDIALSRMLSAYGQYTYYHYELPPSASPLGLLPRFGRHVAMVGLSVAVPLVNDVRPPAVHQP